MESDQDSVEAWIHSVDKNVLHKQDFDSEQEQLRSLSLFTTQPSPANLTHRVVSCIPNMSPTLKEPVTALIKLVQRALRNPGESDMINAGTLLNIF
jgi:hypothetical protein